MPSEPQFQPEMSAAAREILAKVRRMVPPMLEKFHKGQLGRVAVIGGSEDYTGAPYFSAMASAKLGCDMSHVICTPTAAAVIKTYSPNLMVHPLMRQSPPPSSSSHASSDTDPAHIAESIAALFSRLHVLVVGPGLGRDPLMQETVARVLRAARDKEVPVVLDADALLVVQREPDIVRGWRGAVLTPNVVEFGRLCGALGVDADSAAASAERREGERNGAEGKEEESETARVEALARALDGVTIVQKGRNDYISDGRTTLTVDLAGGRKRSGGQGDTLTGAIATFLAWRKAYLDGLWDVHGEDKLGEEETIGLAVYGGSAITRECSRLAFARKGRSLQASDLTGEVHTAFLNLFGEDEDGDVESGSAKL